MSTSILIDGDTGFVNYSNNLQTGYYTSIKETFIDLDTSYVELIDLDSDETFPMWTKVIIANDISTYYFYVVSNDVQQTTFTTSPTYSNKIGLVNPFKKLERDYRGTINIRLNNEEFTILNALNLVRNTTPFRLTDDLTSGALFEIDEEQEDLLNTYLCPELNIKTPSAKIAINIILSTIDAVGTFTDFETLHVNFFDETGEVINDLGNYNTYRKYDTVDEYCSVMRANLSNCLSGSVVVNAFTVTEPSYDGYKTTRSEELELTESNMTFATEFPIKDVLRIDVYAETDLTGDYYIGEISQGSRKTVTVTEELNIFTKNFGNQTCQEYESWKDLLTNTGTRAKKNTFYFKDGSNNIKNVGTGYNNDFGFSVPVYKNIIDVVCDIEYIGDTALVPDTTGYIIVDTTTPVYDFDDILYKIEYIPIIDMTIEMARKKSRGNADGALTINQNDNLIDIVSFSEKMYAQLLRQGNHIIEVAKTITNENERYKLGQRYYEDQYTVYKVVDEKIVYDGINYISQAKLVENFYLRSEYASISNDIDIYNIPKDSKTVTRTEVYRDEIEISYQNTANTSIFDTTSFIGGFMRGLGGTDNSGAYKKSLELVKINENDGGITPVLKGLNSVGLRGGFAFNFSFDSTVSAGDRTISDSGFFMNGVDYTVSGELDNVILTGYTGWNNTDILDAKLLPLTDSGSRAKLSGEAFSGTFKLRKLRGEIPNITLQLMEYPDKFTYMRLGYWATTTNPLVYSDVVDANPRELYFWASTTETYGLLEYKTVKGDKLNVGTVGPYMSLSGYFNIPAEIYNSSTYVSWGIADNDKRLYFWSNDITQAQTRINFNFMKRN